MKEEENMLLHEQKLKACINTLRDVLNEICCTINESEVDIKKLDVSYQLDKLIVEYMNLKDSNYND